MTKRQTRTKKEKTNNRSVRKDRRGPKEERRKTGRDSKDAYVLTTGDELEKEETRRRRRCCEEEAREKKIWRQSSGSNVDCLYTGDRGSPRGSREEGETRGERNDDWKVKRRRTIRSQKGVMCRSRRPEEKQDLPPTSSSPVLVFFFSCSAMFFSSFPFRMFSFFSSFFLSPPLDFLRSLYSSPFSLFLLFLSLLLLASSTVLRCLSSRDFVRTSASCWRRQRCMFSRHRAEKGGERQGLPPFCFVSGVSQVSSLLAAHSARCAAQSRALCDFRGDCMRFLRNAMARKGEERAPRKGRSVRAGTKQTWHFNATFTKQARVSPQVSGRSSGSTL
ncbi:putative transmembrane protein [Toxoplasma gondii TgCatPRC2]|uniref:Putative transmembrane protein n=1 Tax=Toxoplasma gondii TgCatPRC2 TaxID=1130821 RepID=A0A151HEC0_TOXGO|nr:putative transmembrane protein [Toxoplasma gondii TgCatPRC2]